jgi:hypothetical protein
MDILLVLLTVVFGMILGRRLQDDHFRTLDDKAGSLVLRCRGPKQGRLWFGLPVVATAIALAVVAAAVHSDVFYGMIVPAILIQAPPTAQGPASFNPILGYFALLLAIVCAAAIAGMIWTRLGVSLEIHEHGLVFLWPGGGGFVPWRYVKFAKWSMLGDRLDIHTTFDCRPVELIRRQEHAINEALAGRVFLRASDNTLIEQSPDHAQQRARAKADSPETRPGSMHRGRWQFSLTSLMLLTLALGPPASLAGLRHEVWGAHRREQLEPLQALEAYQPDVEWMGNSVTSVDFTVSTRLPDDEAMKHVARLSDLEDLSLGAAPITDQGIAHLRPLKNLRWLGTASPHITDDVFATLADMPGLIHVDLTGTSVTQQGVDDFQRDHGTFVVMGP